MAKREIQGIDRRKFLKLIVLGASASILGALGIMTQSGVVKNVAGAETGPEWPDECDPYL